MTEVAQRVKSFRARVRRKMVAATADEATRPTPTRPKGRIRPYLTYIERDFTMSELFIAFYAGAAFLTFVVVGGSIWNRLVSALLWFTFPLWRG